MTIRRLGAARGTGVFLQARLGSARLPRKALLPLAGLFSVEHAMMALRGLSADVHALLTDEASYSELQPLAHKWGFVTFQGPPDDVLARYALAARHYRVERIVRATGDNPLVSVTLAEALLRLHRAERADYSAFDGAPIGTGVEAVEAEALLAADREAEDPYEREHVCPFLYRRPDRFAIHRPPVPRDLRLPSASVTLDTPEDYRFLTRLFDELYEGKPLDTHRVVGWLFHHERSEVFGELIASDPVHPLR